MKQYLLLLICVLFFSCASEKISKSGITEISVNVDLSADDYDISKIVDTSFFAIIPLETNRNSVMTNNIDRIVYKNERIFIFNKRMKSIFIFNADGKFINKIHNVGDGPFDYSSLDDVYFGENNIFLLSSYAKKVLIYDYNGKVSNRLNTNGICFGGKIFSFKDKVYLISVFHPQRTAYPYYVTSMELDGQNPKYAIPYDFNDKTLYGKNVKNTVTSTDEGIKFFYHGMILYTVLIIPLMISNLNMF